MATTYKAKSYRFKNETAEHLDILVSTLNTTATELIEGMINIEYDKIMGNPELLKVIEQMNDLKLVMEGYTQNMGGSEQEAASPSKSGRAAVTPKPKTAKAKTAKIKAAAPKKVAKK